MGSGKKEESDSREKGLMKVWSKENREKEGQEKEGKGKRTASLHQKKVKVKSLSCVRLFATPWTVAHQAPLYVRFSR